MNPQLAQQGQRFNDFAGHGGFHDGGHGAGWWILSVLAVLLLIGIAGLLVWIGRSAASLRSSLVPPAAAAVPVAAPVAPAAPAPAPAPAAPSLMADPEAPTEVTPKPPEG